jgi:diguanylate cyclase (GGDEF)-like protein
VARTLALLAGAGAALLLVGAALPHGPGVDAGLLLAIALAAAATAVIGALLYDRMPAWGFHGLAAWGTVLASVAAYAWGPNSFYAPLPYAWIVLCAFFFFPLPAALGQLAFIGICFAAALVAEPLDYEPVGEWIGTMGVLGAIGLLAVLARDRLGRPDTAHGDAGHRDPLTGLLDRRGFQHAFELELERARRTDTALCLVVGDLDRLAHVNEERGREVGDDVLRAVGRTIHSIKRAFDSAARVGGEEFALLAPDCDEHGGYMLAERVRTQLERDGADDPVTASFGIATFPLHGQSTAALLRAADQALYAAKRLGRNRSVISSAEVPGVLSLPSRGRTAGNVDLVALLGLAEALDVRDSGAPTHSRRVGRFAELTARELGLPPEAVERVRLAGILHDVGRVGVPDELLRKRGPLSEDDWQWVRSHPEIGARMLATTSYDDIGRWILLHHVRPDGSGYPQGRAWESVPVESRILGAADAYEAMTADRPYRPALAADEAAREMRREAGRQFDGQVVEALLRVV